MHLFKYLFLVAAVFLVCIRAADREQVAYFQDSDSDGRNHRTSVVYHSHARPYQFTQDQWFLGQGRYFTRNPWPGNSDLLFALSMDPYPKSDILAYVRAQLVRGKGQPLDERTAEELVKWLSSLLLQINVIDKAHQVPVHHHRLVDDLVARLRDGRALHASDSEIEPLLNYFRETLGPIVCKTLKKIRSGHRVNI